MTRSWQRLRGFAIAAFVVAALGAQVEGAQPREKMTINDGWYFFPDDIADGEHNDRRRIDLPHTWNAEDTHDDEPGYRRGIGWYRRELLIPPHLRKRRIYLYFEGVNQTAEVFVNKSRVGSHVGGYTAFAFDITDALKPEASNSVAVKVDNTLIQDIPPLDADFNMYGGIYRDVWLVAVDDVHLSFGESAAPGITVTTPTVSGELSTARVSAAIANSGNADKTVTIRTSIVGPDGKQLSEKTKSVNVAKEGDTQVSHEEFRVANPQLWSPDSPTLYQVVTRIEDSGGRILDEVFQPLAFRWFSFDADKGFFLNGKVLKLRGTNRHQDYASFGNGVPDAFHVRDLEIIKENGFNFLRLAHYPQDPAVLEAADRLGILIWEEIPIVNLINISSAFNENSKTMLREMIRQHRNHPSVILWGYMNEIFLRAPKTDEITRETVALARELESICKREDPTRNTVIALDHGSAARYETSGLGSVTDVVGWNLYHGWYYQTFDDFGKFIDDQHRRFPKRPLLVSEFGANADLRVHSAAPRRFDSSVEWQQMFHETFLRQIEERQYLAGSAIWNQFDFAAEYRGETIPHLNQKGMYTFDRRPKDISFFYRANYSARPVLHIATRDRKKRSGVRRQLIKVYTNLVEVELFHNGRSAGKRSGTGRVIAWEADLAPGLNNFRAVGPDGETDTVDVTYVDPAGTDLIAINVGSNTEVIDAGGVLWQADLPVVGSSWNLVEGNSKQEETLRNILGTLEDPLFQRMREGTFGYKFSVPDGDYEVDLRFVERKPDSASRRVFNVLINGSDRLGKIDLLAEAGLLTQVSRKLRVAAADRKGIEVRLEAINDVATLSGISVKRVL